MGARAGHSEQTNNNYFCQHGLSALCSRRGNTNIIRITRVHIVRIYTSAVVSRVHFCTTTTTTTDCLLNESTSVTVLYFATVIYYTYIHTTTVRAKARHRSYICLLPRIHHVKTYTTVSSALAMVLIIIIITVGFMNHSRGRRIRAQSLQRAREIRRAAAIKHDKISPESFLVTRCCTHDLEARGPFNITPWFMCIIYTRRHPSTRLLAAGYSRVKSHLSPRTKGARFFFQLEYFAIQYALPAEVTLDRLALFFVK